MALTGISLTGSNIPLGAKALPVILDSGSTNTLLPDSIALQILSGLSVTSDPTYGNVIPCSYDTQGAQFVYTFGESPGPSIYVALSNMITPLTLLDGSAPPTFHDGSAACSFGLEAATGRPFIFGDTFLRSTYVVYDLDNNQIGLAQTNFNATDSDIQEIDNSIPAASTAAAVSVVQTVTGVIGITGGVGATRSGVQASTTVSSMNADATSGDSSDLQTSTSSPRRTIATVAGLLPSTASAAIVGPTTTPGPATATVSAPSTQSSSIAELGHQMRTWVYYLSAVLCL